VTIIKCINFERIILAPPTMLIKIRHCSWHNNETKICEDFWIDLSTLIK